MVCLTRSHKVTRLPTGEYTLFPSGENMTLPLLYTLPHSFFNSNENFMYLIAFLAKEASRHTVTRNCQQQLYTIYTISTNYNHEPEESFLHTQNARDQIYI